MKILAIILLIPAFAHAANIVLFDPASPTVANRVTAYLISQDTGKWTGNPNARINPVMPAGVQLKDLKVSGTAVVELTAGEKTSLATAETAVALAAAKAAAKSSFDAAAADGRLLQAIVAVIVDQFNTLRTQPTTTFAAVTEAQVRTAIRNKLDAQP